MSHSCLLLDREVSTPSIDALECQMEQKLSDEDVRRIIEWVKAGEAQYVVAHDYEITQGHVSNIINGKARRKKI